MVKHSLNSEFYSSMVCGDQMRRNVENKNNNLVNIRFVPKTSDIRNLSESITCDVMLKYQKWQHWYQ